MMDPKFRGASRLFLLTILFLTHFSADLTQASLAAADLRPATVQAWNRYLQWATNKVERELADSRRFLIQDFLPEPDRSAVRRSLDAGHTVVRPMYDVVPSAIRFDVPDGEIHHWWGAILVPQVTLRQLLRFLQDYDHHAGKFSEVERSRLISRNGNYFKFYLRLRRTKAIVTVAYNTDQECTYKIWSAQRVSSQSTATRIVELENPGTESEHERDPGSDHGYLWRLVSWWRFQETRSGVIVELESASLSRDIPVWVRVIPGVAGYIRATPKESLESVLTSVREYAPK